MPSPDHHPRFTIFPPEIYSHPVKPADVYAMVYSQLHRNPNVSREYIQSPISGGAIRLLGDTLHYTVPEVIRDNKHFARAQVGYLQKTQQLEGIVTVAAHIALPSVLQNGEQRSWKESDYIILWLCVIMGLNPEQAQTFQDFVSTNKDCIDAMKLINNYEMTLEVRTAAYLLLAFYIRKWVRKSQDAQHFILKDAQPITRLRRLAGSHLSPGAQCELTIAEWLGADVVDFQIQKVICQGEFLQFLLENDDQNPSPLLQAIATLPELEFQKILELKSSAIPSSRQEGSQPV